VIIAIDPGQTGAIAALDNGKITDLRDMPTMGRIHGKGQEVDPYTLTSILLEMKNGQEAEVMIEQVSAMPGNGGTSMFHFGESVGVILGVCGALQLPVRRVRPQYWKKKAGIIGKEKEYAYQDFQHIKVSRQEGYHLSVTMANKAIA